MAGVQDELDWYSRAFGCHHTSCGRALFGRRTAAAPWLEEKVRQPTITREPIRHVIEGARAYNSARGLGDPHDIDYHGVRQTADRISHLAREYDRLPSFDAKAVPHFDAMRHQVHDQFDHMTNRMGIKAEFVDHDPYKNSGEMTHDLATNKRIQVLRTAQTGSHPYFSDHENDMFRAVHDVFGHAGTGRDFDKHGEEAAFHAHSRMFTGQAQGALASETRGQNGHLIYHGSFGPQKVALMHQSLWTPQGMHATGGLQVEAADWDEFRRIQDTQQRQYERAGVGSSSREDHDRYFGTGEMRGRGEAVTHVTPKQWMTHSRERAEDDGDPRADEHLRGHEMGYRHARAGSIDDGELEQAHAQSRHPEHFITGYHDGLSAGFGEPMKDRVAVLLDQSGQPVRHEASLVTVPMPRHQVMTTLRREAHVSGNQVDVLHCFAGEERYLTPDGPKSFIETVGTTQKVLTSARGNHEGQWVEAPIRCYGEQEIWELTLQRNKQRKVIRTTAGHRWMVGRPGNYRTVITEHLSEGHRLAHLRTLIQNVMPTRNGIRQGVMFGDGSIARRDYGQGTYGYITLWDEKTKDLAEYFDEISVGTRTERDNGLVGTRYTLGTAGWTKELPVLSAAPEFLRGWLMGYIATDGNVDQSGKVSLSSSVIENLEHVRNIATLLGLGTYGVTAKLRKGYGDPSSLLYTVAFASGDLDTSWLLRQRHRDAFSAVEHRFDRFGWTVTSVEQTDEIAPVYCAEVPGTESFVLEDNIWTKNCPFCGSGGIVARSDGSIECSFCNSAFTVTVSPVYPAFPMSVDGQPYPWPGRPADDPSMMGDPNAAVQGGSGFGGQLIPGGGAGGDDPDDSGDGGGNPFADDGDDSSGPPSDGDSSDGSDSKDEAEVGGKKKPPFGKKSGSRIYSTVTGGRLHESEYLRHLALTTASDPNAMAAKIRAERRR